MALTMIQFSYISEVVGKQINNLEDRSVTIKKLIENPGGKEKSVGYKTGNA